MKHNFLKINARGKIYRPFSFPNTKDAEDLELLYKELTDTYNKSKERKHDQ
jgi:hypothetical protein